MLILAFESSAKAASVALVKDGKLLSQSSQVSGLTHSRTLLPMAEDMLKNAELSIKNVDAFAVAHGPGSFTGIRIGVAAAKGLAFGADKPAVGVSTLAAMARNVAFADGLILCAMDARRQQIYNALFEAKDGVLTRLTEDRAISLADLAEELRGDTPPITAVGDGGRLAWEYLNANGIPCRLAPPHLVMQNAASVALEAEELIRAGKAVSAQELDAVYLRPAQAERLRTKK